MGPIGYAEQSANLYFNRQPSTVKSRSNEAYERNRRYLYTKLFSVYKFTLPDSWKINWFRFWLFEFGSISAIYTKEFGWVCMPYTVTKLDIQYNPAVIQVYNQFFSKPKTGVIGVNSGIVHVMDDFFGLDDLVDYYAKTLALIERGFNISAEHANVGFVARVKSKKQADTIKEAYGDATTGKPMVYIGKDDLEDETVAPIIPDAKKNYLGAELMAARRQIINDFLTDVGINNNPQIKAAQQGADEMHQNDDEVESIVNIIYDNISQDFEDINKISDLGLTVEKRYSYRGGGVSYGETDAGRDV